jgi:hypothetical protein
MVIWKNDPDKEIENTRKRQAWASLMEQTHKIRTSIWGDEKLPDREERE